MKKLLYYLFSLLLLFFAGCKSDVKPDQLIIGRWIWEETSGGWNGMNVSRPGSNEVVATFFETGLYEERVNGVLSEEGKFKVETNTYTDRRGQTQTSRSFTLLDRVLYATDGKTARFAIDKSVYIPLEITTARLVYADVFSEGSTHRYRRK